MREKWSAAPRRIAAFDALRGFALVNMAVYHGVYDWVYVFGRPAAWFTQTGNAHIWLLKEREVGVEIDTSGHYLVRQGDGKNKFFDLPIIVNNARYEEILELTQGYMNTVNNFSKNMTEATNSANSAAKTASDAAASATAGAKACEGIVDGLNTMVDTVTKKTCVLSIEDGILTIREA